MREAPGAIRLFLCGDVMTGRGIDQILPHSGDAKLHESFVRHAQRYVELAERASGAIDRPVGFDYVWGDALEELERRKPAASIVNLETAVTRRGEHSPAKGIHYRMHPRNATVLTAAKIDCCVLANNHVLDFGEDGLLETLDTLSAAGIAAVGAGRNAGEASAPAWIAVDGGRCVLVFAYATESSGVPPDWAATNDGAGVNVLPDLSSRAVERVSGDVAAHRRIGDIVVVSLHWGGNWGYEVSHEERAFAHALLDTAGADLVHGHSSHHAKGIEMHEGKLVLYGCGDFVNDYEGIQGYEPFRPDLAVMYLAEISPAGRLLRLDLVPFRSRQLRLRRATAQDTEWLCAAIARASHAFGTRLVQTSAGGIELCRTAPH